jgi:hypothetical protein
MNNSLPQHTHSKYIVALLKVEALLGLPVDELKMPVGHINLDIGFLICILE